ncbi:hypothetical protein RRF57_013323 [Xylaria bambusicola]|uniref:Uncharacterized protein n=1 Tax=Xylaria bambusicola TaxID=326684 RepID=A0AAN7V0M8_9PEZI
MCKITLILNWERPAPLDACQFCELTMGQRRYAFTGTDDEYIGFLEQELCVARLLLQQQSTQSQSLQHQSSFNGQHEETYSSRHAINYGISDHTPLDLPPLRIMLQPQDLRHRTPRPEAQAPATLRVLRSPSNSDGDRSILRSHVEHRANSTSTQSFIHFDPNTTKFERASPARLPWSREFVQNIPKSEDEWHRKREALGLLSPEGILTVFDCLSSGTLDTKCDNFDRAAFQRADMKSAFLTLAPVVAQHTGYEWVNESMRAHFSAIQNEPRDISDKTLERYRKGVLSVVRLCDTLYVDGHGNRIFESIFHGGAPVTMYDACNRCPAAKMKELFKISAHGEEIQASLPFHLAFGIMLLFPGRWSFDTVCEALCSNLFSKDDLNKWMTTYKTRQLVACYLQRSRLSQPSLRGRRGFLDHLESDTQDLATLVALLGGNCITLKLLERASSNRLAWGSDGNIELQQLNVLPVLSEWCRCQRALRRLDNMSLITFIDCTSFSMPEDVLDHIISSVQDLNVWKLTAVKVIVHVFPEHRHLEPANYFQVSSAMIPQLRHVLQYLDDAVIRDRFQPPQRIHIANVCLSGSYFSEISLKETILTAAEKLLIPQDQTFTRIRLRRMALARISQKEPPSQQLNELCLFLSQFRPEDKRSNAYFGEMIVFASRLLIDLQQHQGALSMIERFRPCDLNDISRLEQSQLNDIELTRGEILRYEGRFEESYDIFLRLLGQLPSPPKIITQLSAVACELEKFDSAITMLNDELKTLASRSITDSRNGRRLQLALAEAYVMKAVKLAILSPPETPKIIDTARGVLNHLSEYFAKADNLQKVGKINRFKVVVGWSIIEHLTGDPRRALESWDNAQAASRECWPEGFTDMVILYSKCELMYTLGDRGTASRCRQLALRLYRATGRKYYLTGLGSIWMDYVESIMKTRHRIEPLVI